MTYKAKSFGLLWVFIATGFGCARSPESQPFHVDRHQHEQAVMDQFTAKKSLDDCRRRLVLFETAKK